MKNKMLQKIATVLLSAAMIIGMGIPASASGDMTIDTTKRGSITVHKYEGVPLTSVSSYASQSEIASAVTASSELRPEAGIVFRYLKVGDVLQYTKHEGTVANVTKLGYSVNAQVSTLLGLTAEDADKTIDSVKYYTASTLDEKLDTFLSEEEAVKTSVETLLSQAASFPATDINGTATVTNLPLGLYLVSEYNYAAETTGITEPFFVSLPMTDVDTAGNAFWNYNVNVYPKNQMETLTVDKVIVGNDGHETKELDIQIDDNAMFRIRADVPNYVGKLKTFRIEDTLSNGLTYDADSYVVYGIDRENQERKKLTNGNEYQFSIESQKLIWTFRNENISQSNTKTHLYDEVEIVYTATLNSLAVVGAENGNDVSLIYSATANQSTQEDPTITVKPNVTPGIFTYAVDLHKYGNSDESNPLKDVTFELQDAEGTPLSVSAQREGMVGEYYIHKSGTDTITTGADGHIFIKGLEAGTYYLKETNTKQGFHLLKKKIEIQIGSNENTYFESATGTYSFADPGTVYEKGATRRYASGERFLLPENLVNRTYIHFNTAAVTQNGTAVTMHEQEPLAWNCNYAMGERNTADAGVVKLYVNNMKMFQLPMTGDRGDVLFLAAGIALLLSATAILAVGSRRRKKK